MPLSVRIFFLLFFLFLLTSCLRVPSLANDSISPTNFPLQSAPHVPSITFGDLLNYFSSESEVTKSNSSAEKIRNFLNQLDASTKEARNNSPIPTFAPIAIRATPYIPIPTLISGIYGLVNPQPSNIDNQFSTNPQLSTNNYQFPTTTLLPTVNSSFPTANYQLTTNNYQLIITPTPTLIQTTTIAILGDSMVDTLGKDLSYLRQMLTQNFPSLVFNLLNYGQGATDLQSGLYRLTNETYYQNQYFPALLSQKPDILIVESFAYNPWRNQPSDLDQQWLTFAKILDKVTEVSPKTKIILAATIAPNTRSFGDGVLNWPSDLKWKKAVTVRAYLQNLVNFATSQNYPLANAYYATLGPDGDGSKKYINAADNLHPSEEGKFLFSQKILETIISYKLIQ